MRKKTIIFLSILSALLTLFHVIASYKGWDRLLYLRMFSLESYTKNYMKKLLGDTEHRVVVLSTCRTEKELRNVPVFVKSILDQTVRVNEFVLFVPYSLKNKAEKYGQAIRVIGYKKDYGPMNTFVYGTKREENGKTKLIILDCNTSYGKDYIESMLDKSNERKNCLIFDSQENFLICSDWIHTDLYPVQNIGQLKMKLRRNEDVLNYQENFRL